MLVGAVTPSGTFAVKELAPEALSAVAESTARVTLFYPASAPTDVRFPILVYFADWDGTQIDNRRLLEDLTSHGFVIAAVTYPNSGEPMDFSSQAAFEATVRIANARAHARMQDAARVLDWVDSSGIASLTDTSRAGILGYSFGGAVAAEACASDQRFRAALNIDGWHFGEAAKSGTHCPYMLINDATPEPTEADLNAQDPARRYTSRLNQADFRVIETALTRPDVYALTVANSNHADFAEPSSWLRSLFSGRGSKNTPRRNLEILRAYALAFFAKYLLESKQPLIDGNSKNFPDVQVRLGRVSVRP